MKKIFNKTKILFKIAKLNVFRNRYVSKELKHKWMVQKYTMMLECDQMAIKEYDNFIDQLKGEL